MTALAEKFGATVDKFVGDAVVCFFGAPAETDEAADETEETKEAGDDA